ncbi:hypothetical protein PENANT_c003G08505 [Penicillium antarcticum]|uniref:Citrate exporter 1 n=1 Tax=Penicillium antarcticum TaxID=416450 RepID=A0A1V6QJB1_9EURO|nr:hypothetical protein PENANT_c003G08505 [Penicillium antarcticum]
MSDSYNSRAPLDEEVNETMPLLQTAPKNTPYSVFTPTQKRLIILSAALASSFSPLSANIYYPALNSLARDLHVSASQINLTITSYMVCQGLAPMFTGSLADRAGRRPVYILCFVIYICANISLALQHNFQALLLLRGIQSCGSSGTVALASAVAADIITSAERGTYMGFTTLGNILAPSIGPIIGGALNKYLGWQAIFWFLVLAAGIFFVPVLLFFPETCRVIVGNGSVTAVGWNSPLWKYTRKFTPAAPPSTLQKPLGHAHSPWSALRLLFHKPVGLIILSNGVIFASYYAVTAGIPVQVEKMYNLDGFQIGLCFIPAGLGSLLSATANGVLVDWNYRRIRCRAGLTVHKNQKQDILGFPIEKARLQIGLPMTILASVSIVAYGALLPLKPPLLVSLLIIFAICFCITAAYSDINILIVDLYHDRPATVMAANNLVRCFLGAGAAAAVNPLIRVIETTIVPEISGKEFDCNKRYLVLFVDLDVIMPGTSTETVILHWYQSNLFKSSSSHHPSQLVPDKNHEDDPDIEAPYIAPRAPPNTHHRYVYFLFEKPPAYRFPRCFAHIFPLTMEARAGFDVAKFIQAAKLDSPLAMNYFVGWHEPASGDPSSAVPSATTTSFRFVDCATSSTSLCKPDGMMTRCV